MRTVEVDAQHLMSVADFGERQRQRAAAIAQAVLLADPLGQVQVAQRDVRDVGAEHRRRQRFRAADHDAAFGIGRRVAADHVAVTHREDGLARRCAGAGQFVCLRVEQPDAGQVGVEDVAAGRAFRGRHARHVARPQERDRDAPGVHGAVLACQRDDEAFEVDVAGGVAHDVADDARAVRFQQRPRRFQPARRIVVAGDDDDVQLRRAHPGLLQEPVQLALRRGGRVRIVEHVARDQQGVRFLGDDRVEQPVEKAPVLVGPVEIVQGLAEVPVGSVQQPHGDEVRNGG